MKHSLGLLSFALVLALMAAGFAFAAGSEAPATDRIVRGTLTAEGGTEIAFSTLDGVGFFARSVDEARFFEITPQVRDARTVNFMVQEFADADRLTALNRRALTLSLDGKKRGTDDLPFSMALTGITFNAKVPRARLEAKEEEEIGQQAECCVGCGRLEVCCEPAAGWCCELECIGGDTCSACTAFQ